MSVRRVELRKGQVKKDVPVADGAGMDEGAEEILFSVALPDDAENLPETFTQAGDNAEERTED